MVGYEPVSRKQVLLGDGRLTPVLGRGRIDFLIPSGRPGSLTTIPVSIHDALHVPELAANLLSVSRLTASGLDVSFQQRHCIIRSRTGEVLARADKLRDGMYHLAVHALHVPTVDRALAATTTVAVIAQLQTATRLSSSSQQLAHERMGHLSMRAINLIWTDGPARGL
jgi:hypothetical protein